MDYWIKIGTKMVPAVVTAINHKIDVNTGELLKASMLKEMRLCAVR